MNNIHAMLTAVPILKNASDDLLQKLSQGAHLHHYKKGKLLFIHEEVADSYFVINSGWVKLFRETLDGTQAVVDILSSGNIFGETAIFEGRCYPYSAEIVEAAEIISLPLSRLASEIKSDNMLALSMLGAMAHHRRQQDREIEHLSIQNASQRIGCFLLRLAPQYVTGCVVLNLPYDKTLVASRLGMQPETFSRALARLRDKAGLHIKGATIELESRDKLINYVCAVCSSEFPCQDTKSVGKI